MAARGDDPAGRGQPGGHQEHERSWRAAAGLVGVLAGLLVVLWLLSLTSGGGNGRNGRDADPEDGNRPELPATTTPVLAPEAGADAEGEHGEHQGAAVAEDAEQGGAMAAGDAPEGAAAAGRFSDLDGRLVYLSGSHVAVVDLATGALETLPLEPFGSVLLLDSLALLTDGRRTVGVSLADDPPTAVLIASGAELVPSAEPLVQYWVISRPDGPDGAVRLNAWQRYGVLTGELVAPPGSEVLAAGGAGVLVIPPVGRTFQPRLDGFEVISEHRLLAASDKLRVEQRCDENLSCVVVATDAATGQTAVLPDDFVAELAGVSISPDGRWLLNDTSPAWLFDRQTGGLRLLDGGGYGRPQWSDDSGSVAWLTSDRTPTLVVARLAPSDASQDWFAVELAGLGADPSPGSSFLLTRSVSN